MNPLTLHRAKSREDIDIVAAMWTRSAAWLRNKGSDQWQYPVKVHNIEAAVAVGACWLVYRDGEAIGTITLDTNGEPQYWLPEDEPDDALYVHRMVVEQSSRGEEIGSALLDWAGKRAEAMGRHWLRLDAWRSNEALHRYYEDRGFQLVRTVSDPSGSGACFQRPASLRLGLGPTVIDDA
jgi:GNAT superfamily N-acetyltransferase